MKKIRITVAKVACYTDLIEKYENPIEHACSMHEGQEFIADGWKKPEDFCDSAWDSISPFVMTLAHGGSDFYDGWMKNPKSAMISCNDGFRPVSFLLEVIEEEPTEKPKTEESKAEEPRAEESKVEETSDEPAVEVAEKKEEIIVEEEVPAAPEAETPEEPEVKAKYCGKCGAMYTGAIRFCVKCGYKLSEDTAPETKPAPKAAHDEAAPVPPVKKTFAMSPGLTTERDAEMKVEPKVEPKAAPEPLPILLSVRCRSTFIGLENGCNVEIEYRNDSDKTIRWVAFSCLAYDSTGHVAECQSTHIKERLLKAMNSLEPGKRSGMRWKSAWINSAIARVVINSAEIEYEDGSRTRVGKAQIGEIG